MVARVSHEFVRVTAEATQDWDDHSDHDGIDATCGEGEGGGDAADHGEANGYVVNVVAEGLRGDDAAMPGGASMAMAMLMKKGKPQEENEKTDMETGEKMVKMAMVLGNTTKNMVEMVTCHGCGVGNGAFSDTGDDDNAI